MNVSPSRSGVRSGTRSGSANRPRIARPVSTRPDPICRAAIHACRLTSPTPTPVDNGNAAAAQHRLAWMALRAIGGGRP